MHRDYPPCQTSRARLDRDVRAMQLLLADPSTNDLVLERLPNGEPAWLRPASTGPLVAGLPCGFGLCRTLATRRVETRSMLGRRVEWLCAEHAARRIQLDEALVDEPVGSAAMTVQVPVDALRAAERWLSAEVEGSALPDQHEEIPSVGPTCVHCDIVALHDQLRAALALFRATSFEVRDEPVDAGAALPFVSAPVGRATVATFVAQKAG